MLDIIRDFLPAVLGAAQVVLTWLYWCLRKQFVPRDEFDSYKAATEAQIEELRMDYETRLDELEASRAADMLEVRRMFTEIASGQHVQTAKLDANSERMTRMERNFEQLLSIHLEK